ncbi:hypothetical protein [Hymenobacter terrenus]|uniref:hypothetical protein n=1 Tax=Hymenobacter terrenus TaxID=1629124 RepID=UPI0006193202|nr:hypothetical protein [Hymenobacter terrenus]
MLPSSRLAIFARVVLLPAGLVLGTIMGLGSYCETSDDVTFAWLFSGVLALKPVPSVPLYFHGYGHVLATAYTAAPGMPWLGLLLGALLSLVIILLCAVLDKLLRPHLRPAAIGVALMVFFIVAGLEHWLWFSHVRVALLLAGAAVLFAAQRPGRPAALALGLAGVGAAWLLRPSAALLGFAAVLPGALVLAGSWRRVAPIAAGGVLGLALAAGVASALQTPIEARTQFRDRYFARILDFDQLRPQPHTPADSLGTAAISLWLLGDATVVNEELGRRAYQFDAAHFWGREVPAKLWLRAGLLVRDYFPLLFALAATAIVVRRRVTGWFWLVQLGFAGALGLCAGLLKLPPRLALPLLDFWLFTNLAFWLKTIVRVHSAETTMYAGQPRRLFLTRPARLGAAGALLVLLAYGAKVWHRRQILGQERSRHEQALVEISRRTAGRVRVLAGTNDLLKSLSPFRTYRLGPGATLLLSGWSAHDPSQLELRQHLAGTTDQTACLRRLAESAQATQWLLSAETAQWLNHRFQYRAGPALVLRPEATLATDSSLRFYQPLLR